MLRAGSRFDSLAPQLGYFGTKLALMPVGALFALMIVVPSGYQVLKAALIVIIFGEMILAAFFGHPPRLHPKILLQYIGYISLGSLYGIYGLIQRNAGALPITKEVVLYVFIYMVFNSGITSRSSWKYIHNTLIYASSFLCLYLILSALNAYGLWPDWLYYALETDTGYLSIPADTLKYYGQIAVSSSSLQGLMFLQPYVVGFLISNPKKRPLLLLLLAIAMTVIMVLSGRRVLLIVAVLSPVVTAMSIRLFRRRHIAKPHAWRATLVFAGAAILILTLVVRLAGISIDATFGHLTNAFRSEEVTAGGVIPNVRMETIQQLFEGWKARPIFGFGNGASYAHHIRSDEAPWNYEVQYMQFLYSWGIVGCALYAAGIASIARSLIGIFKSGSFYAQYAVPLLLGMSAFLVGNATNPYLLKFDALFVIFLPVTMINLCLLERRVSRRRASQPRTGVAITRRDRLDIAGTQESALPMTQ